EQIVQDCWEAIVREHAPIVFGAAWRILGHAADAEDVAQEVFFEAFRKWQLQPDTHWTGLFRRLAVCRALDYRRKRKATVRLTDFAEVPGTANNPTRVAVVNELVLLLRKAVDQLPRQQAAVFCLRYFEDLNSNEIAAALGIKPGAVATALSKARTKLE